MPRVLPQHTSQPIPEHPHHNGLTSVALRVCSKVQEYVGEGIQNGRVHGCTGYTHTKGERGLSLEFTDSILGKLKTAGILTRLVRCALAPHTHPHLKANEGNEGALDHIYILLIRPPSLRRLTACPSCRL